ncbi:hypothetical protein F442_11489 [Phytophthora nicotianae P10297]|uniref:DUF6818 domain-containing protein n=4 Tax=Phytophthora nicotianae TaxID=4792 RepID=W2Q2J2_PHYN3|nr:hypothetical protein PPTG_23256 [Phytophthora nicotianae INRA-310]ETI43441.1 hypothetical protein F443_11591 [Phytophthora nicotianae P1569]ETL90111.1 hypothetical protein L917_11075 [Phytophthora nicotianae]ETN07342.1 hypothetical protein PPTG_23256 [Phytophthora nicotianae INRA-310]ETP41330.1 hypothetical protein F442_11489 [Phytophthora nicotianae P10297]
MQKPKPSGNQGDEVPERLKPVLDIQFAIEAKGGAVTFHDGADNGEDDAQLRHDVVQAISDRGPRDLDYSPEPAQDSDGGGQGELSKSANGMLEDAEGADQPNQAGTLGSAITSQGVFDVTLADDVWSADDNEEEEQVARVDTGNTPTTPFHSTTRSRTSISGSSATPRLVGCPQTPSSSVGPQRLGLEGPVLTRNPQRFQQDVEEEARTSKNVAGNCLGWQNLWILWDNLGDLDRPTSGSKAKRTSSDGASNGGTYTATRRARARKRMDNMEKEATENKRPFIMFLWVFLFSYVKKQIDAPKKKIDAAVRTGMNVSSVIELNARKETACDVKNW